MLAMFACYAIAIKETAEMSLVSPEKYLVSKTLKSCAES
jgi:hypothetical protein